MYVLYIYNSYIFIDKLFAYIIVHYKRSMLKIIEIPTFFLCLSGVFEDPLIGIYRILELTAIS